MPEILAAAIDLLKRLYRSDFKYRKVMIGLTGLENDNTPQYDLFDTHYNRKKDLEPLMQIFDKINSKYGRGTIKLCTGLLGRKPQHNETSPWKTKHDYLSPCYTTSIEDIPGVY
jgi:hypothetical protein